MFRDIWFSRICLTSNLSDFFPKRKKFYSAKFCAYNKISWSGSISAALSGPVPKEERAGSFPE